MISSIKSIPSIYITGAVTLAAIAVAAAVFVDRKSKSQKKDEGDESASTEPLVKDADTAAAPEPAEATPEPPAPAPVVPSGNKKLVVLMTSYTTNPNQRANQAMAMTILKGMKIGDDQMETIDGSKPENKEKRNELFGLSGIRAKYPQFFVVDQSDATTFLADWEGFQDMNEMGSLKESINLAQ